MPLACSYSVYYDSRFMGIQRYKLRIFGAFAQTKRHYLNLQGRPEFETTQNT